MEITDSMMQALHISNKGPYLDTLKRFYILRERERERERERGGKKSN
jgi:hypothetical protein